MRGSRMWRDGRVLLSFAALALVGLSLPAESADRLIHEEDFSRRTSFDSAFWSAETGFFRNKEAQYYRAENVSVGGGSLTLEGRRESAINAAFDPGGEDWRTTTREARYTSGSLISRDAFTYGVFEVTARIPRGAGTWPAIWMIYEQGVPYREIDILEAVGSDPDTAYSSIHAGHDLAVLAHWPQKTVIADLARDFHVYRLEWRKNVIAISIDGRERLRMNPEEARKDGLDPLRTPMRLRLNLALGGSWGGRIDESALPARFEIKSIRIWRVDP